MILSIIAALDERGGIGHHGRLPWRLAADMRRFKAITIGHHIIMGRKTWEAINRPLPGRTMIVVTRKPDYQATGCIVVHSFFEALELAKERKEEEVFIIGGGELYQLALPLADRIYLTRVHTSVPADVYFPEFDRANWVVTHSQEVSSGENDEFSTTFYVLERMHLK